MTSTEIHARLEELLIHCPSHEGGSPRNCPIFHIRQLTEKSRYRYLETLSEDAKRELLRSHIYCSEGLLGNEILVN